VHEGVIFNSIQQTVSHVDVSLNLILNCQVNCSFPLDVLQDWHSAFESRIEPKNIHSFQQLLQVESANTLSDEIVKNGVDAREDVEA